MEGNRRFRCLLWKVPEGDRNGRKREEGTGIVKKDLASTSTYVARYNVINHGNKSAVQKRKVTECQRPETVRHTQ